MIDFIWLLLGTSIMVLVLIIGGCVSDYVVPFVGRLFHKLLDIRSNR